MNKITDFIAWDFEKKNPDEMNPHAIENYQKNDSFL